MTDPYDPTEVRVRAAFANELRKAETDLALSPLGVGRRLGDRRSAAGTGPRPRHPALRAGVRVATAALILVLAAGAGLLVAGPRFAGMPEAGSPTPSHRAATPEASSPTPTNSALSPGATASIPRYSDGIPSVWQGQPVLRWADALARRYTAKDDTSFLVGVWLNFYLHTCPVGASTPPAPSSWVAGGCSISGYHPIGADAGVRGDDLTGVATLRFIDEGTLRPGPAILRVHVHDPRASLCGPQEATCDTMIVAERAIWTGDSATEPRPFSVSNVVSVAASAEFKTPLLVSETDDTMPDAITLRAGNPSTASSASPCSSPIGIGWAYVMPSVEAMHRALPYVQPGAAGALLPSAQGMTVFTKGPGYSCSLTARWLVVDNVAFSVAMPPQPSSSDLTWLASLEAALRANP